LRPAWTAAAPSSVRAAMEARPECEPMPGWAGRGTPSPSVASEVQTRTEATERERHAHLQAMGRDARLRKHGDRGRGLAPGRHRRQCRGAAADGHRARAAAQAAGRPGRDLRQGGARLRQGGGPAPAAGAGPGHGAGRAGGSRAAGGLPRARAVAAAVPRARHGAARTRFFDDQVAWLAAACSKTTITALMRISWRTAGTIARVAGEAEGATDRLPRGAPHG